ncbi:MAG TPA: helix-turn-helix domain-containing protein [Vicinamibacterales bacterium]|nr:helix-turn-helix domain-containing protein [Vicinamibacterales bacterium]
MKQARQAEPNSSAERIRGARLALHLTQKQVAAELGWRQARVSSYERGHFAFSSAMELRILDAIGAAGRKAVR